MFEKSAAVHREVDCLVLLEEQEGKPLEARAPSWEGGEVGTCLLAFSYPVAWDVGPGRRKVSISCQASEAAESLALHPRGSHPEARP